MAGRNLFLRSFENKWPVSDKLLELRNRPLFPVKRKLIRLILLFFLFNKVVVNPLFLFLVQDGIAHCSYRPSGY